MLQITHVVRRELHTVDATIVKNLVQKIEDSNGTLNLQRACDCWCGTNVSY